MNFGVNFGGSEASVSAAVVVGLEPVRFRAACQYYKDCTSPAKSGKWACSSKFTDEQRESMCMNFCRLRSCSKPFGGKK